MNHNIHQLADAVDAYNHMLYTRELRRRVNEERLEAEAPRCSYCGSPINKAGYAPMQVISAKFCNKCKGVT